MWPGGRSIEKKEKLCGISWSFCKENKLVVRLILRIPIWVPGKQGPDAAQIIHNAVIHVHMYVSKIFTFYHQNYVIWITYKELFGLT